jgi:hypothetical protein
LGLFEVKSFLDAQKCGWVLRAKKIPLDNWKIDLTSRLATLDIFFRVATEGINSSITKGIIDAYNTFYKKFLGINNNFLRAPIFGNEFFTVTLRTKNCLSINHLDLEWPQVSKNRFYNLTINKLSSNGNILTKLQVEALMGVRMNRDTYNILTSICSTAKSRYAAEEGLLGLTVSQSFRTWKKGSRRFRTTICNDTKLYVPKNLVKFSSNVEIIINTDCAKKIGNHCFFRSYSNAARTFFVKLYHNVLPYNTALSHFVRGKSRNCTFCDVRNNPEIIDETPLHLFYDCEASSNLLATLFSEMTGGEVTNLSRHEIFCCFNRYGDKRDLLLSITSKLFLFYLWECKLRLCIGTPYNLIKFVRSEIKLFFSPSTEGRALHAAARRWNF